ncbi:MAG: FHA domain-containing protein [Gammaproteobacteria bacterium]|nr:FHA domain-containing protein [Gammaproteobacteria bacterium]
MTDKKQKVGPQGTQVFDLSEVESLLAKELKEQSINPNGQPALVGISKPVTGKKFLLTNQKYQVGRVASSDICIDEPSVSSTHAKIVFVGEQWKVVNLLSSNGTYVNGDKVSESDIYPGDQVRFGGVEFMFCTVDGKGRKNGSGGLSTFAKVLLVGVPVLAALGAAAYFVLQ